MHKNSIVKPGGARPRWRESRRVPTVLHPRRAGCRDVPPFVKLANKRSPRDKRRFHETHAAGRRHAGFDAGRRTGTDADFPLRRRTGHAGRRDDGSPRTCTSPCGAACATSQACGSQTSPCAAREIDAWRVVHAVVTPPDSPHARNRDEMRDEIGAAACMQCRRLCRSAAGHRGVDVRPMRIFFTLEHLSYRT